MADVEVATLKLRCRAKERDRTRFAIEDGLRTALPDEQRLVLVRRMNLAAGLASLMPAERQQAVREGWLAAIAGARHGRDDGAAASNCVWFASRSEAEGLLLARLLAGREADAWFWRLAVPGWRGQGPALLAADGVREALANREHWRLLEIARRFLEAGMIADLVSILAAPDMQQPAEMGQGAAPTQMPLTALLPQGAAEAAAAERIAERLGAAVPPLLGALLKALRREGPLAASAATAIARAWALRRSPALALAPQLAAAVAAAIFEAQAAAPGYGGASTAATTGAGPAADEDRQEPRALRSPLPEAAVPQPGSREQPRAARRSASKQAGEQPAAARENLSGAVLETAPRRLFSSHAGLWLVVPSLNAIGFREWLAARPHLLADHPGGLLLREIARHHRVPADDPAFLALGPEREAECIPGWAQLWRHGLDRWLRRRTHRRLHDLVGRAGELVFSDLSILIHYPPADADIALRRAALDRDPGWTDWLGLSVRYSFGGTEDWL